MKGSADERKLCWSDEERKQVQEGARPEEIVFLNPDDPITDPNNFLGQFGRDMYQIMIASAIVVDARERRGIGIGVEMAAAAAMGTPIIVVAPRNSKYRTDVLEYRGVAIKDYIHPHVHSLAFAVVDSFAKSGKVLQTIEPTASRRRSVPAWLEPAISEYETNVLFQDAPMVEAMRHLGISS